MSRNCDIGKNNQSYGAAVLGHIYKSGVEKIDVVFQEGSRKKTLEKKKMRQIQEGSREKTLGFRVQRSSENF